MEDSDVIAAHTIRQQARLRRNICTVDSDVEWKTTLRRIASSHCGAFVFFRRYGCPSCNSIAPKMSEASNDFEVLYAGDVIFVEIDVDKCKRTAAAFRADTLAPFFCMFSHGVQTLTFSGVSTQVFSQHMDKLRASILTCQRCTSDMRACFDIVGHHVNEAVQSGQLQVGKSLRILQCEQGFGRARFEGDVPSGEKIVPFDINSLNEPVKSRLELLEERLVAPLSFVQLTKRGRHNALALEFLTSNEDEGLQLDSMRSIANSWLTVRLGHASLWVGDELKAATSIVEAALARRAARVEFWLLHSLSGIQGRVCSRRQWSEELRKSLYSQFCVAWLSVRACVSACDKCELPCSLRMGHDGNHSCSCDDHKCHRFLKEDTDGSGLHKFCQKRPQLRCQMHGGHSGPCRIQAPLFDPGEGCLCAICLDPLPRSQTPADALGGANDADELPMLVFPCQHGFHVRCVEPWLRRSGVCPLCRSPTHPTMFRRSLDTGTLDTNELGGSRSRHGSSSHLRQLRRLANAPRPSAASLTDEGGHLAFAPAAASAIPSRGLPALPALENLVASAVSVATRPLTSSRSVVALSQIALPPLSGREGAPVSGRESLTNG